MPMFGICLIVLIPTFIIGIALQKIRHADVKQTNSYSDNNYIFWTKWVRGICKTLLTIGAVGSLIIGTTIMGILFNLIEGFAILVGIVVIAVGIFISITFFALIMMISEISVNTYKSLNKESGAVDNEFSGKVSYPAQTDNNTLGESLGYGNSLHKQNTHDFWICRCGCRNQHFDNFCRSCGNKKQ